MNFTPNANRKHIGIYGNTNSGKSSLMNKILNQDISLVSNIEGTTTDPVQKAMELIPFGPVLLIDTAGLEDKSELGEIRIRKSFEFLKRLDFAIYVVDGENVDIDTYKIWKKEANKYNISHMVVINKLDKLSYNEIENINKLFNRPLFISAKEDSNINKLKEDLIKSLEEDEKERPILGDVLPYGSNVVLVVPIDSEAPKGRIILPQVQVIRDCLDNGIKTYVVRDTELSEAINELNNIDLVITDSQAFKEVENIIPKDMKLTSFSILFARQKGELKDFFKGTEKLKDLKVGDKVLICESCTHNISHEDIGRVKIPRMLKKMVGGDLDIEHKVGYDFREDVEKYDLIIHCGACMVNRKSIINKINICREKNVSITNYGMVIAYFTNILNRSVEIFKDEIN
ncbi:[FeFe] hydrogenase H-cluster maturation GTPase HydF [Clostridium sp. CCUG 7971]|uniref:[FeFe] hydrogenase H-cluster maturation GTPase HydF n=1 Tax=Clostridium sp. CCUG 7971 TaxID=2811414 RepID=UPI001ABBDE54|nr:[FeFe] hydrogenase H-cluster maturation GTPase HydF [Clostridium sp. CCUG 7971]MBO3443939.1 [FeFe] hydrogenase H-cluster maturation GTPase HydF [Clostridium sp. CCUG 7971]